MWEPLTQGRGRPAVRRLCIHGVGWRDRAGRPGLDSGQCTQHSLGLQYTCLTDTFHPQTDVQPPTTVRGRCLKFDYAMAGLSVAALRVWRVELEAGAGSGAGGREEGSGAGNLTMREAGKQADAGRELPGRELASTLAGLGRVEVGQSHEGN